MKISKSGARAAEPEATARARSRYDRIAGVYDAFEGAMERVAYRGWRSRAWERMEGRRILELGVGTGKNLPFHPRGRTVVAVDLSLRMMRRAVRRARDRADVRFAQMDAQALAFPDATFDVVVATFVFCSVPDPVLGLREAHRVLSPDGRLVLLEHVLSRVTVLRPLMRLASPFFAALTGADIARETVENVRRGGFDVDEVVDLGVADIFKLILARKPLV